MNIRLLASFLCILTLAAQGAWTAPADPDPSAILQEAIADTAAARYKDSLAKHVWYHQNALKLQPSQSGVRLSFALSDWVKLSERYPAALKSLKAIRDAAEKDVRNGKSPWEAFFDFSSINRSLDEPAKTKELFVWLDKHKPALAKRTFDIAQPALVSTKEYRICGRYIDPDLKFAQMKDRLALNSIIEKDAKMSASLKEHSRKSFINGTSTLVALLVINDRKDEADEVAAKALKEMDDPKLKIELEKAKKGTVPESWP